MDGMVKAHRPWTSMLLVLTVVFWLTVGLFRLPQVVGLRGTIHPVLDFPLQYATARSKGEIVLLYQISPGMSEAQLRRQLGKPDAVMSMRERGQFSETFMASVDGTWVPSDKAYVYRRDGVVAYYRVDKHGKIRGRAYAPAQD